MARQVKCKFCGKQMNINDAYKVVAYGPKSGKPSNLYYCNTEHYQKNQSIKEKGKMDKDKVYSLVCEIIGRKEIINTALYKEWQSWNMVASNEIIYQYLEENSNNNTCKIYEGYSKMYDLKDEKNKIQASVCTSSENFQQSFLNSNYLQNGGTINRGLIYGARDYVNAYLKKKKMLDKKNGEVSHTDIEESLSFVVCIESTNVEYENQTKLSTNKAL